MNSTTPCPARLPDAVAGVAAKSLAVSRDRRNTSLVGARLRDSQAQLFTRSLHLAIVGEHQVRLHEQRTRQMDRIE